MIIRYDPESDAVFFVFKSTDSVESEEIAPGVIVDFDDQDNVIAMEVLNFKEKIQHEVPLPLHLVIEQHDTDKRTGPA